MNQLREDPASFTLLSNCQIFTDDPTYKNCNSILIKGNSINRIFYCPPGKETIPQNCTLIDCSNNLVIPGLNDAHIHLLSSAAVTHQHRMHAVEVGDYYQLRANLLEILGERVPDEWICGYGLDDRFFSDIAFDSTWIDKILPNHPTCISNQTGHAVILNSKALELTGMGSLQNIDLNGVADVTSNGLLTGKFFDMNSSIFHEINQSTEAFNTEQNLPELLASLHQQGVTSVQDAGHKNQLNKLDRLATLSLQSMPMRIGMMLECSEQNIRDLSEAGTSTINKYMTFNGLKIMLSESTGQYTPSQSELGELINFANSRGFRVAVHAVEEAAIKMALLAFKSSNKIHPHITNRLEHCSEYNQSVIACASDVPFYVVTQPGFISQRGDYYIETNCSNKISSLYPLRTILNTATVLAFSSDSPVISHNPWLGLNNAQTRLTSKNIRFGEPFEQLSFEESITCYTKNAAIVEGQSDNKGIIDVGMLADLAILNKSSLDVDLPEGNPVMLTLSDGQIVWNSQNLTLSFH